MAASLFSMLYQPLSLFLVSLIKSLTDATAGAHVLVLSQCHRVNSSTRLWANDANENSRHVYRTFPTKQWNVNSHVMSELTLWT